MDNDAKVDLTEVEEIEEEFVIVDTEETKRTRMLTLNDCDAVDAKKKSDMQKRIENFRKDAPVAMRAITSTINAAIQEVKRNMRILQADESDEDQKKRAIRQLKEAETSLEKNEKVKTNWLRIMDSYMEIMLDINEENYCNEWRLDEIDNRMAPFRKVLKEALVVARKAEEQYFSCDSESNLKDPGEKSFPDLTPRKLEFGEPPEAVYIWLEETWTPTSGTPIPRR